jgi:UDP-N-acetylmuramoyl-L-alanyl-D-glutamate--2,6-diaminopimelate ligase
MIRSLAPKLSCNVITCGFEEGAVIRAKDIEEHKPSVSSGISFAVQTPRSRFKVNSNLIGRFNMYNILMSIGIGYSLGIGEEVIQQGIENVEPIEGRFEKVDEGQRFLCIVDYAHTEDALRKLIQETRCITEGRIITVFGCGGDRDKMKRPLMGAAASELSDLVVVTSDNPRSEEPLDIIEDIVQGIKKNNYTRISDREEAIKEAVSMAKEGDALLIAGKGHEDYQEIKGVRQHFSDKEVLRKEIREKLNIKN